jgi:hypothetical protein
LMGKRKFVVVSQQIVAVAEPSPQRRNKPYSRIKES